MLNSAIRPIPNRSSANYEDANIIHAPGGSADTSNLYLPSDYARFDWDMCAYVNTAAASEAFLVTASKTLRVLQAANSAALGHGVVLGAVVNNLPAIHALAADAYSFFETLRQGPLAAKTLGPAKT